MKTPDQLKVEHAKQIATLEREHATAKALTPPPERVMILGKRAPWATYKVATVAHAVNLFKGFADAGQVVNMEMTKGTFTSIGAAIDSSAGKDAKHVGDFALALTVNVGQGFESVRFYFYVKTDIGIVRVCVDFEFRAAHIWKMRPKVVERHTKLTDRVTERERFYTANDALNGYANHVVSFATGDMGPIKTGANHHYLFMADDGADCSEFEELFNTLQNMVDEFDPRGAA